MRRTILAIVLSFGALSGFASGFHSLRHHGAWHARHGHQGGGPYGHRRDEFEQHVAALCARAAIDADRARTTAAPPRAP